MSPNWKKRRRTAQRSAPEGRETVGLKRERQAGNPALLMGVFRCIAKRDAMLGLTQKSAKSAASGPPPKRMPSKAGGRAKPPHDERHGRRAELSAAGRPVLFAQSVVLCPRTACGLTRQE